MITPRRKVSVAEVAHHYDELDRFYREVWGLHVHHGLWRTGNERPEDAVRELVRLVAGKAEIAPGGTVCDVGCGYGATARQLVDEYDAEVLGLTISPVQFAVASRGGRTNPRFLLRDWNNNGLESSSFAAVISIECLSHVDDKERFFAEVHRVLQPGKRMVLTAWLAADQARDWQVRHLLEPICREGRLAGLATAGECEHWIGLAGLELVESRMLGRQVRRTWSLCARRALARVLTRSDYRRFLLSKAAANRVFLVTLLRIWLAYRVGAMDYGLFVARKPVR